MPPPIAPITPPTMAVTGAAGPPTPAPNAAPDAPPATPPTTAPTLAAAARTGLSDVAISIVATTATPTTDALPTVPRTRPALFHPALERLAVPPEPTAGPKPGRRASITARTSRGVCALATCLAASRPGPSDLDSLLTVAEYLCLVRSEIMPTFAARARTPCAVPSPRCLSRQIQPHSSVPFGSVELIGSFAT